MRNKFWALATFHNPQPYPFSLVPTFKELNLATAPSSTTIEPNVSYLVISVPPSSTGSFQDTLQLSWNTSDTLQNWGGTGLSAESIL